MNKINMESIRRHINAHKYATAVVVFAVLYMFSLYTIFWMALCGTCPFKAGGTAVFVVLFILGCLFFGIALFSYDMYCRKKRVLFYLSIIAFCVLFAFIMSALLYVWSPGYASTGCCYPPTITCTVSDAPENLDNGADVNQIVVLFLGDISYTGHDRTPIDINKLYFFIKRENETNWTELRPSGGREYNSSPIMLSNNRIDTIWNVGEAVILFEPTPNWITTPGKLYVKIIHAPSDATIYEGSVCVS
ncbi:MAG: hypothetical protein WC974_02330 [Thermoplasmata archaeon]